MRKRCRCVNADARPRQQHDRHYHRNETVTLQLHGLPLAQRSICPHYVPLIAMSHDISCCDADPATASVVQPTIRIFPLQSILSLPGKRNSRSKTAMDCGPCRLECRECEQSTNTSPATHPCNRVHFCMTLGVRVNERCWHPQQTEPFPFN